MRIFPPSFVTCALVSSVAEGPWIGKDQCAREEDGKETLMITVKE